MSDFRSDFPVGRLSQVLVGHVWPSGSNLAILNSASADVGNVAAAYLALQDQLRQARFGPLADQEGVTADDVRAAFERGEEHARTIAEKYETKRAAFQSAHDAASALRAQLTTIADDGHRQIMRIQDGHGSAAEQLDRLVGVVLECQTRANAAAAIYGQDILDAVQKILGAEGIDKSARKLAAEHGVDTGRMFGYPHHDQVREQLTALLSGLSGPT